jgi:hypothetical protein
MDIDTWRAMLERRGYKEVSIEVHGKQITYSIAGIQGVRGAASFASMTNRKLRHEIENQLGRGMEYVYHRCGCPLLRARAGQTRINQWYERKAPLFHSEYYAIPLRSSSRPLTKCPQCWGMLKQGSIHKIVDPETIDTVSSI